MAEEEPILVGGRYTLLRQLGAGGMASVWLAADRRLNDKPVAVKRLHGFRLGAPGAEQDVERARREAYAASRVSHPNLVSVTDFIAEGGEPFIVMEYVDGVTLDELTGLSVEDAARLAGQVAAALAAAHAAGIVHRDIKPSNIIVTAWGDAKLADFGIARAADDPRFTRTGAFTGTMRYLAPEVLDGVDPDPAADMWALGATLFEAAEGRPAFDAPTTIALMAAIAVAPLPVVTRSPALAPIIARLLDRDPGRRPSAAETAAMLRSIAAPTRERRVLPPPAPSPPAPTLPGSSAPPTRPGARPKRRTRAWMVVAVPSVVALVAGVAIAISANEKDNPPTGSAQSPTRTSYSGSTGISYAGVTVRNPTDLTRSPGLSSSSSSDATALATRDLVVGKGAAATATSSVLVEYVGVVYRDGAKPFDTTWTGAAEPRRLDLDKTVAGFRRGVAGGTGLSAMRVGGRRLVIIPAELAYGASGAPTGIPPNASLAFVVDLRAVTA